MKLPRILLILFCSLIFNLNQLLAQAPANDECSGAIVITPVAFGVSCSASVSANTSGATRSLPNPSCTSVENNDDIWYSFTATSATIILRFSNVVRNETGSEGIVGASLYQGACPTTTTTLLCNNIASAGAGFLTINSLTIGTVYYLRFWSTLGGTNTVSFNFCVQEVTPVANDECTNAIGVTTMPVGSTCNSGISASTVGATLSNPTPVCGNSFNDDDIWYRFTANTGAVRINFSNARTLTSLSGNGIVGYALYEGSCPSSGTALSCQDIIGSGDGTELIGGLTPGNQYYLRFYSYATNNYIGFDFCLVDIDLPTNDECMHAINVPVSFTGFCSTPVAGNLDNSTISAGFGAPACLGLSTGEDVWFKTTVPASGSVVIQTSAVNNDINDLLMEAYSGACGTLTLITCDDDGNPDPNPSALHPRITLTGRTAGEVIYLRVLGKGVINWGPFAICAWDPSVQPAVSAGGNCVAATPVTINTAALNHYTWVPVFDGSGNIMAEIFANGNNLNLVNASLYVNSTGTVRDVNGHHYLDRNLTIQPAGTGTARVRLYFKNTEWNALQLANPSITALSALKLNKVSTGCSPLFNGTSTVITQDAVVPYGSDYYIEFSTPSFSTFYIDGLATALPLEFLSFTAQQTPAGSVLQWSVVKDASIVQYDIQQSNDGRVFTTIANVQQNNFVRESGGAWHYSFTDIQTKSATSFYRIRMTDANDKTVYSHIAKTSNAVQQVQAVKVYPNPVQKMLFVELNLPSAGAEIMLTNSSGTVIRRLTNTIIRNGIIPMNMQSLAAGIYQLRIIEKGTGSVYTVKVLRL